MDGSIAIARRFFPKASARDVSSLALELRLLNKVGPVLTWESGLHVDTWHWLLDDHPARENRDSVVYRALETVGKGCDFGVLNRPLLAPTELESGDIRVRIEELKHIRYLVEEGFIVGNIHLKEGERLVI